MAKNQAVQNLNEKLDKEYPTSLPGKWTTGDTVYWKAVRIQKTEQQDYNDKSKMRTVFIMVLEAIEDSVLHVPDSEGDDKDHTEFIVNKGQEYSLWLTSAVLYREFKKLKPNKGETGATRYMGAVKDDSGKNVRYHNWKVVVDREEEEESFDWDSFDLNDSKE